MELLVVISIILILVALMVGGLDRALKASQRIRCATNQRNLAQQCVLYSQDQNRIMPPKGTFTGRGMALLLLSSNVAGPDKAATALVGLGHLVPTGYLPTTKLGDIGHCPSLDTTEGAGSIGMDEFTQTSTGGHLVARGLTWWASDKNTDGTAAGTVALAGSYYYRVLSFEKSYGGKKVKTDEVGSTFVLLSDTLDDNVGIRFHHVIGYNRAFADGSAGLFRDESVDIDPDPDTVTFRSNVERVPGHPKYPYSGEETTNRNTLADANIACSTGATATVWVDEAVFDFLSVDRPGFKF